MKTQFQFAENLRVKLLCSSTTSLLYPLSYAVFAQSGGRSYPTENEKPALPWDSVALVEIVFQWGTRVALTRGGAGCPRLNRQYRNAELPFVLSRLFSAFGPESSKL